MTHKNALADVEEFTAVAVTAKGIYTAPGRKAPAGERRLYLLIEGPDAAAVKAARRDIKQRLEEAAAARPHDDKVSYGRYSVV